MGMLDDVREGAAYVAERSRWVHIDFNRLEEYAARLKSEDLTPRVDAAYFFQGSVEETAAYVLTFTAINFGSGWHPVLRKLPGTSGSITMMTHLSRRFHDRGPLTASEMSTLTPESCTELFGQNPRSDVDELMELFAKALNDLGRFLSTNFDGSFVRLVESANDSAEALAERLLEMPLFRDVSHYDGRRVPLLKRAQIASADLAAALGAEGLGSFQDLDKLTIFADNLVPQVLRIEGVLRFDLALVERIDREELLLAGSEEEIEIRAVAIHAAECITKELRKAGSTVTAAGLDYHLWLNGQDARYKAYPRHRCRTPFY